MRGTLPWSIGLDPGYHHAHPYLDLPLKADTDLV